ncbi:MAG: hypothetical protein Q4D23_04485 [Bacteroidales bacterium]|nr:hypothetical protein [Bacteroidales bacterium]
MTIQEAVAWRACGTKYKIFKLCISTHIIMQSIFARSITRIGLIFVTINQIDDTFIIYAIPLARERGGVRSSTLECVSITSAGSKFSHNNDDVLIPWSAIEQAVGLVDGLDRSLRRSAVVGVIADSGVISRIAFTIDINHVQVAGHQHPFIGGSAHFLNSDSTPNVAASSIQLALA